MTLRIDSEIGKLRSVLVHQPGHEIERPATALSDSIDSLFVLPPIPNYFFQRDPAMVVGDRVIRASMATPARLREPLLNGIVFAHHPRFAREDGGTFWFREFSAEY